MIIITVFIDLIYDNLKHQCTHIENRLSKRGCGLNPMERLEDSLFKQNMIRIADLVLSLYAVIVAHFLKSKYKGF